MVEELGIGDRPRTVRVHYYLHRTVYHARMKHIDIRYHWIKEILEEGEMELVKVHTKENPMDALMKVLPQDSF